MKKSYILVLVAIVAIFSISAVSAGLFDGLGGGGDVKFLDLTMKVDGADFEEGDTIIQTDSYKITLYNLSAGVEESREAILAETLDQGASTKFDESSITEAFTSADSSIGSTVSFLYPDKESSTVKCAKTITSFNQLSDYKDLTIDGHPAADFIVSDNVLYDDSGSQTPSYLFNPDDGKTSTDLERWVLIYDESTSTLYGVEIQSTNNVLTDKSVLQGDDVQSIIDSITIG